MDLSNGTSHGYRVGVFSGGMLRLTHLAALLGASEVVARPRAREAGRLDFIAGWGNRPTTKRARRYARRHKLPFVAVEDGFLHSAGAGGAKGPPVAVALDDLGIYYDARKPSRLERLIAESAGVEKTGAARSAMQMIRERRLSKYNPPLGEGMAEGWSRKVLLVDQVFGDMSIEGALAGPETFATMLSDALETAGADKIALKVHPDTLSGDKRGYLADAAREAGIEILSESLNPYDLLDRVEEVWTVSSQLGYEALLAGRKVRCYGVPFYACWGLTEDKHPDPDLGERRAARPTLEQMFRASHIAYQNYADPITGRPGDVFSAIDRLTDWREKLSLPPSKVVCAGFSRWKRPLARAFLGAGGQEVRFAGPRKAIAQAKATGSDLAVWGMRGGKRLREKATEAGVALYRVEDGFLRSVGLGSDIVQPASLCVDAKGMYFDPSAPSDLEALLAGHPFPDDLLARAAQLRQRIVAGGVSKYNAAGGGTANFRSAAGERPVLLVIGQVPDDASIRYGAKGLAGNLSFLEAVRAAHPDAYIVYKEHPDLVRRNRAGWLKRSEILKFADKAIESGDVVAMFGAVDAVHTLTSLTGFEALLREVPVVTWGRPFYAGWGLTSDRLDFQRRKRELTLDQLVAGALLLYPRYVDPLTGIPCAAEDIVSRMEAVRADPRALAWPKPGGGAILVRLYNRIEARLRHWFDPKIPK